MFSSDFIDKLIDTIAEKVYQILNITVVFLYFLILLCYNVN